MGCINIIVQAVYVSIVQAKHRCNFSLCSIGGSKMYLTLLGLGVKGINRKFPLSFSLSVHFQLTFTFTSTFQVQLGLIKYYIMNFCYF